MSSQGKSPEEINREYKGMSVATVYGQNKHQYRIESINFDKGPQDTFELKKEAREITFADYFKEKYQCPLKDLN